RPLQRLPSRPRGRDRVELRLDHRVHDLVGLPEIDARVAGTRSFRTHEGTQTFATRQPIPSLDRSYLCLPEGLQTCRVHSWLALTAVDLTAARACAQPRALGSQMR